MAEFQFRFFFILPFAAKCEDGNKTYAINQTYLTSDCKQKCKCEFINGTAIPNCSSLCAPPGDSGCSQNTQQVEEYQQPLRGTNCSCPAKRCIAGLELFRNIQLQIVPKKKSFIREHLKLCFTASYENSIGMCTETFCSNSL